MGTLGSATVRPYPGTVSGTIAEAMARLDALIAQGGASEHPAARTDPWEILAYLAALEAPPGDAASSERE